MLQSLIHQTFQSRAGLTSKNGLDCSFQSGIDRTELALGDLFAKECFSRAGESRSHAAILTRF